MKKAFYSTTNAVLGTLLKSAFSMDKPEKRTSLLGRSVIVRQRKLKHRDFEVSRGEVFDTMHCGLWSISVEHKKGRSVSFNAIKDDQGVETVA